MLSRFFSPFPKKTLQPLHQNRFATFWGQAIPCNPQWIKDRCFAEVAILHGLSSCEFKSLIIPKSVCIDIGCGDGALLHELRATYPDATLVGATATPSHPRYQNAIDKVYYGLLPSDRRLFRDYFGQADIVLDTMGALTYADNPIHVLVALCSLLKKGGVLSVATLGDKDASRLGDEQTLMNLKKFLCPLGMQLKFSFPLRNGVACQVKALKNGEQIAHDLTQYFNQIDSVIGVPSFVGYSQTDFLKNFPSKGLGYLSYEIPGNCYPGVLRF